MKFSTSFVLAATAFLATRVTAWQVNTYSDNNCQDFSKSLIGDDPSGATDPTTADNGGDFIGSLLVVAGGTWFDTVWLEGDDFLYLGECACDNSGADVCTATSATGVCESVQRNVNTVQGSFTTCDAVGFDNDY